MVDLKYRCCFCRRWMLFLLSCHFCSTSMYETVFYSFVIYRDLHDSCIYIVIYSSKNFSVDSERENFCFCHGTKLLSRRAEFGLRAVICLPLAYSMSYWLPFSTLGHKHSVKYHVRKLNTNKRSIQNKHKPLHTRMSSNIISYWCKWFSTWES